MTSLTHRKCLKELKEKGLIADNAIALISMLPANTRLLPSLRVLVTLQLSKASTLKLLRILEKSLAVSTQLETKAIHIDPLVFYDYLLNIATTSSQLSQLYAVLCLHHLITQHQLSVPSFLQMLYNVMTPRLLLSPVVGTYYDRLYRYLSGSYTPLYASAAFVKKTMRLCLEGPSGGILIGMNFVVKMLYALPQIHFLLKRPSIPMYRYPEVDPFEKTPFTAKSVFNIDLRETNVEESFLWEHLLLQKHVHPKIALLAQSFPQSEEDTVVLPPDLGLKLIVDPKVAPPTTSVNTSVNPFVVVSNDQGVNTPSQADCDVLGLEYHSSLYAKVFD